MESNGLREIGREGIAGSIVVGGFGLGLVIYALVSSSSEFEKVVSILIAFLLCIVSLIIFFRRKRIGVEFNCYEDRIVWTVGGKKTNSLNYEELSSVNLNVVDDPQIVFTLKDHSKVIYPNGCLSSEQLDRIVNFISAKLLSKQ